MQQLSIKDQIRKLVQLQKLDQEIYNLNQELNEKPRIIDDLKVEFENKQAGLKALEAKAKNAQLDRKEKELELKSKEESISKSLSHLSQIKTNREYTANLSEIEHIKVDKAMIEEKILNLYDVSDGIQVDIEKAKAVVAQDEKHFLAKKHEVEEAIKVINDRLRVLESQRVQIAPDIDKVYLTRYEKVMNHKGGLGITPLTGLMCGGCYMNLTPQIVNLIKMYDHLVECEKCSRILYLEDDI